jgi:hypothetical protein
VIETIPPVEAIVDVETEGFEKTVEPAAAARGHGAKAKRRIPMNDFNTVYHQDSGSLLSG